MTLQLARKEYKKGNITFNELDKIFEDKATEKQKQQYWNQPLFDRPGFIIGKSQKERDKEWNDLISC